MVEVVTNENGDHEQCARYAVKAPPRGGGSDQRPPLDTTETVCIDEDTGALRRVIHSFGQCFGSKSSTSYDDIIPFQGRFLARHIRSTRNGKLALKITSARRMRFRSSRMLTTCQRAKLYGGTSCHILLPPM